MNENLFKELSALAEKVNACETETNRAIKNMNEEIEKGRSAKEQNIVVFLNKMAELYKSAGFEEYHKCIVLCCGSDWDGVPNACGSHRRDIGVSFNTDLHGDVHVVIGRYFSGSALIDYILGVTKNGLSRNTNCLVKARQLRESVVDRWSDETENRIEKMIAEEVKKNLEQRLANAATALKKTNDDYEKYAKET